MGSKTFQALKLCPHLLLLFMFSQCTSGQNVLSCNGYVKSDFSVDFSQINIGLFTEHGSQRDKTDCAPSTGYFFLPVEQHGKYILKVLPPSGWTVNPSEMVIQVDGKSDACSLNQDIIFHFSGFSIFGKVSSKDKGAGPSGISLSLFKKGSNDILSRATSDSGGNFEFQGLRPDSYIVGLGDESLESFSFEKRQQEVVVGLDSVSIPPFVIIGYDVEGTVVDRKGNAIQGVGLDLFTEQAELKTTVSDEAGKYRFSNVSRGTYFVKPSNSNRDLSLQPASLTANVFDKNVAVDKFVVEDFVLQGQVLWDKNGAPLIGAVITGKQDTFVHTAKSTEDGSFSLKGAFKGEMIVSCVKDGVEFEDAIVKVFPSLKLPTLFPSKYRVAGTVELGDSTGIAVHFKRVGSSQETLTKYVTNGKFDMYLPIGEYRAKIVTDGNDGETYLPKEVTVTVKGQMLDELSFQLARFSISGSINCLGGPCDDTTVILQGLNTDDKQLIRKGTFAFTNVRKGTYTVSIQEGNRCWSTSKHLVDLKGDTKDIAFSQVGFFVDVAADHDSKLVLHSKKTNAQHTFDLTKGKTRLCVDGSEQMSVSTEGCYGFQANPNLLTLGKDDALTLTTISFKVYGQILTENEIPDLQVKASSDKRKDEALKLIRNGKGYAFELDSEYTESLVIKPSSKKTFFEPSAFLVKVKESCNDNIVEFQARDGVFVQGSLSPSVEGALVQVSEESGSTVTAFSEKDGTFKIGPFVNASPKKIIVTKEGYFFEETEKYGMFSSRKLSSITISVKDEQGRTLPEEAVIAISGGIGFKNSAHTKDGSIQFTSLHPGEYFVKAFLKEWTFEPRNIIVQLAENKNEVKVLIGKRIAFSAIGEVVYLNGNRASGVVVLGKGTTGECLDKVEDSVTSADGIFRLRGLEPQCTYEIESGNKDIQSFITRSRTLKVSKDDVKLSSPIIAHGRVEVFHVSINVKATDSTRKTIPLKISAENDLVPAKLYNIVPNQLTLLPAIPIIDAEYVIKVDGKVVRKIVRNNTAFQYVSLDLIEENKTSRRESSARFYYILPLTIFALVAVVVRRVYYHKE